MVETIYEVPVPSLFSDCKSSVKKSLLWRDFPPITIACHMVESSVMRLIGRRQLNRGKEDNSSNVSRKITNLDK